MFTAMVHRPLVWLLAALALLGAGWAAYGPLRQALQPATDTAERSTQTEPATAPEAGPVTPPAAPAEPAIAAPPATSAPPAPEVAAVKPEPEVPPPAASEPAVPAPAPSAEAGGPSTRPPPAPTASPAEPSTAKLEAPSAASAAQPPSEPAAAAPTTATVLHAETPTPTPEAGASRPSAVTGGTPEVTTPSDLAPAAGPPTPPAPPATPLEPTPEGAVAAAPPEPSAPVAPQAAVPAIVKPSGTPPATAPVASEATPASPAPPPAPVARPPAEPEVAKTTPLPSTEPAEPEVSAEASEPPPRPSLSLDTIRRALAALLGGPSEPSDVAGRKAEVERPAPESQAVKPQGAQEVAKAAEPSPGAPEVVRPSFDIVRVEPGGRAVVAGRAAPGAEVELLAGDRVLDRVRANRRGEWVATPTEPLAPGGLELSLRATSAGAPAVKAEQVVVVVVPEPPPPQPPPVAVAEGPPPQPPPVAGAEAPPPQPAEVRLAEAPAGPLAVLLSGDGRAPGRILQAPGRISSDGSLALLVLDYDDSGRTRLTGEAPPGAPLRIYVDNEPAADAVTEPSGRWTAVLEHNLAPGEYTLRLDQLGSEGRPVARLETPFTRVSQPPIQGKTQVDYVIVQPGNSLWRIARRLFGRGMEYVQIYDANKAQIRDPDLIYPGQVFEVPPGIGTAG